MNERHRRFAEEYSIDHNGTKAAIRAGYSQVRAAATGSELIHRPDVAALVAELDAEKRDGLGIAAEELVAKVTEFLDGALAGDYAPMVGMRAAEFLGKVGGMFVERAEVEHKGHVVFTLDLDRDTGQSVEYDADDIEALEAGND